MDHQLSADEYGTALAPLAPEACNLDALMSELSAGARHEHDDWQERADAVMFMLLVSP